MSRKGHYLGGSSVIGKRNPSYFSKDSMVAPKDDGRPDRLPTAGTVRLAAKNTGPELIKAGDPRLRKKHRRHS